MKRPTLAAVLLASTVLAGCTVNSGVDTTSSFAPARFAPQTIDDLRRQQRMDEEAKRQQPLPSAVSPGLTGPAAVLQSTAGATIEPTSADMSGSTWVIKNHQPNRIYLVPIAVNNTTTILFPPGEMINGAVSGDARKFIIATAYVGSRLAVSVTPRYGRAASNLQVITSGDQGLYSFQLRAGPVGINAVDIGRARGAGSVALGAGTASGQAIDWPQPQGDYTPLTMVPVGSDHLPSWAPVEVYADTNRLVARFNAPLPVLPALFAGQKGEQMVSYRSEAHGQYIFLLTSRRVTEAELRLDQERVRITVDPDATKAGMAPDPALGADGWRSAESLPTSERASNLAFFVLPPDVGAAALATLPADALRPQQPEPAKPVPVANPHPGAI